MRTGAASAVATRVLARPDARVLAVLGAGVQARSHIDAATRVREFAEVRVASRSAEHARALADEVGGTAWASFEEAVAGADVVCACTDAGQPIFSAELLEPGMHVTSVGASRDGPELDPSVMGRGLLAVESRVAFAPYPAGAHELQGLDPDGAVELGEILAGARKGRSSPEHFAIVQVDGACGRRRGGGRARLSARARGRRRRRGRAVIAVAEIEAARERLGRLDRPPAAHAAELRGRSGGYLPQAREPAADGLIKLRRAGNAILRASRGARAGGVDGERRRHGAGRRLVGRTRGVNCSVVPPVTAPGTKIEAIGRLGADMVPVTFDAWGRSCVRARSCASTLFPSRFQRRRGDGGERHDRARDPRGPARCRRGDRALRWRRSLRGLASAARGRPVLHGLRGRGGDGRSARSALAAGAAGGRLHADFVDGIGSPEVFQEMFALAAGAPGRLARRRPRRRDRSSSAPGRTRAGVRCARPRAPARRRSRSRETVLRATARSFAWFAAGGPATRRSSQRSSPARVPASRPQRATRPRSRRSRRSRRDPS